MWVFLTGLSNDMVSLMGPYSWMSCSMCNAYADWGVVVLYVSGVFTMSYGQSSAGLAYVRLHSVASSWCFI